MLKIFINKIAMIAGIQNGHEGDTSWLYTQLPHTHTHMMEVQCSTFLLVTLEKHRYAAPMLLAGSHNEMRSS